MGKMFARTTASGTAASETALCDTCMELSNAIAINISRNDGDDALGEYVDCSENPELQCQRCGYSVGTSLLATIEMLMENGNLPEILEDLAVVCYERAKEMEAENYHALSNDWYRAGRALDAACETVCELPSWS